MTPEEACEYLDISMDDDLDLAVIERNYQAKLAAFGDSQVNRRRIDDAYNILLELYDEFYRPKPKNHEGLLMKMALLLAGVFLVSFGGVMYFVYKIHSDNVSVKEEPQLRKEYDELLRKFDELSRRQRELVITPQVPEKQPDNTPPTDYAALVEQVMPSMVLIETDSSRGSGFFVTPAGDILTNYHVIEGGMSIRVTTHDGRTANALVKDYDAVRDMALIKITLQSSAPFLKISNALPRQGEAVIAIGNPRGLTGSVSNGIVSAIRESDNNTWVQFTAPISPGSSGGALVNLNGEVIGMPTILRTDGQNLNFAVAPTVLNSFRNSAVNKTARQIGKIEPPKLASRTQPKAKGNPEIPGTKFIRDDDEYEIYLCIDEMEYDKKKQTAAFLTLWLPKEKAKIKMRKDSNFNIPPGEDLGPCILVYIVNFKENKYLHLRTINYCMDGSIARDYIKPEQEFTWRTPKNGSRIYALMNEVKRQLRIR